MIREWKWIRWKEFVFLFRWVLFLLFRCGYCIPSCCEDLDERGWMGRWLGDRGVLRHKVWEGSTAKEGHMSHIPWRRALFRNEVLRVLFVPRGMPVTCSSRRGWRKDQPTDVGHIRDFRSRACHDVRETEDRRGEGDCEKTETWFHLYQECIFTIRLLFDRSDQTGNCQWTCICDRKESTSWLWVGLYQLWSLSSLISYLRWERGRNIYSQLQLSSCPLRCSCCCGCCSYPPMDLKAETPKQMLGRVLNTTSGNSETKRSPALSPSRASGSPSSPLLEYTKQVQRAALDSRTAARVRELMQGGEMSPREINRGSSSANEVGSSRDPRLDTSAQDGPNVMRGQAKDEVMDSPSRSTVPPTAARKNVTQRRPRGKLKDEGWDTAPRASLLARRPRSRSKDRRYSIESTGGEENCERQDWRSTSARFQPYVVPSEGRFTSPLHVGQGRNAGGQMVKERQERNRETRADLAYRVPSSTNIC